MVRPRQGWGPLVREDEVEFSAIRAQGCGARTSTRCPARRTCATAFPMRPCPMTWKERLLGLRDHRITAEGVVVIKAQTQRSQEQNRLEALQRLQALIDSVAVPQNTAPDQPTRGSRLRRLQEKSQRGLVKQQRSRPRDDNRG